MNVYTRNHTMLVLKEPPLNAGGEGAIYEIVDYPDRVAKIYHDTVDEKKRQEKVTAMIHVGNSDNFKRENLSQDIAWPLAPLFDNTHRFLGFGMKRIDATAELDELYVYPSPQNGIMNVKDRVKILISLCDVIDRLHRSGQVFGDFNPNNIKVGSNGNVKFVDADSYHIKYDGKEYRCIVCAPGYIAPEVIRACKGTTYEACLTTTFTKKTDDFALAIHVFRMLMNGCHPFVWEKHMKRAGSAPAPKSIDWKVEAGESPFFKQIPGYTTPHYAPDINSLPPYIRILFEKAFVDGHANPNCRPTAAEWKSALIHMDKELRICNHGNGMHYFWKGYYTCPYCDADERHSLKMKQILPATTGKETQIKQVTTASTNSNSQTSLHTKQSASVVSAPPAKNGIKFWSISLTLAAVLLMIFAKYSLRETYVDVFDDEGLAEFVLWGSVIVGMVASINYNRKCSRARWWDYILSILIAIVSAIGFGVMCYILIAVFIIALFISFFFGG